MMKKQILFLSFFVLASLAGMTDVFGQGAVHHSEPEADPTCTNDALHPMAGKPYDYSVIVDPLGGNFTWWATTNQNFITGGVLQNSGVGLIASPNVVRNSGADYNSADTENTINLTWSSDAIANAMSATPVPTFVAVHYSDAVCTDNLKVYQIEPINAFLVDILNLEHDTKDPGSYGVTYTEQCYDNVASARWDAGSMVYDYGTNVLYFEVVAANFTEGWTPTFQLNGLIAGQTATMVWSYDKTFATTTAIAADGTTSAVSTLLTDTSDGVSIFVEVTISNTTYEGLTNDDISLAVIGTNAAGQRDVLAADCTTEATFASNTATQQLQRRPTVTDNTDDGVFEQP